MTHSGTHDSESWNFIQTAMKGFLKFTEVGVYYFYMSCEAKSEINSVSPPFLDSTLKESSVDIRDKAMQVLARK